MPRSTSGRCGPRSRADRVHGDAPSAAPAGRRPARHAPGATPTFFGAAAPFASGGVYVNFLGADEGERVRAAYGPNYDRLVRLKREYDPDNLFRMNQSIEPA